MRAADKKRKERLHDTYQTALSRETLLSEQLTKELLQARRFHLVVPHIFLARPTRSSSAPPPLIASRPIPPHPIPPCRRCGRA